MGRSVHSPNTHLTSHSFYETDPIATIPALEEAFRADFGNEFQLNPLNEGKETSAYAPTLETLKIIVNPLKKSKLSHNLRSLGPPKRASELEASIDDDVSKEENNSLMTPEIAKTSERNLTNNSAFKSQATRSSPFETLMATNEDLKFDAQIAKPVTSKDQVTKSTDFFRSLESLKHKSPLEYATIVQPNSKTKRHVVSPSKAPIASSGNFLVYNDGKRTHEDNNMMQNSDSRAPLSDISSLSVNKKRIDCFVKPSFPTPVTKKTSSRDYFPTSIDSQKSDLLSDTSNSVKKMIVVNGIQYEKLELLGRGGSSKVYKVREVNSRRVFALKKVDYDQFDESCVKGFKSEIEHLTTLKDHPRVVSLKDYCLKDGSIYLVMECGEVDLAHVLQNRNNGKPVLDIHFVRFQAAELFRCVQAVHQAGIVHSDLKPANFLFVKGFMKIIDFGIANAVPEHTVNIYRESQIGTPNYMAPETLIEVGQANCPTTTEKSNTWKVGKPSDVWSCGCILYQMMYGKPPYAAYTGQKRVQAIMNPDTIILYPENGIGGVKVPQSAIILMRGCLDRIPGSRLSIEECLNSDFLKPKVVSKAYVRDLIYSAINYGMENRDNGNVSRENYDELVETVIKQIEDLNFA